MVGVTVIVPLKTPGQEVGVELNVPVNPAPGSIVVETVPVQPSASLIITVCAPVAMLINVAVNEAAD